MSKAERIKEVLGWLKVVFAALLAIDISLIAWIALNFRHPDQVLVVLAVIGAVATSGGMIVLIRVAAQFMAELEKL